MLISGPITLARASYVLAGEDIWKLVLLVALISINLAVVNFLPIPVLDGGHMVFLFYEWIRRKPPPVFLHNILTIIGLVMVLSLMLFAVGLDIWRLIFQG
jgi:regulator of sigma E protease